MAITIRIPGSLQDWLSGRDEAVCMGGTVRECFVHIDAEHPGFYNRVTDDAGGISQVLVFLNGDNIKNLAGLDTSVRDGDEIGIIPLAAGG